MVLAHDSPGKVAAEAPGLLLAIGQALVRTAPAVGAERIHQADPVHEYRRQARRLLERYGEGQTCHGWTG